MVIIIAILVFLALVVGIAGFFIGKGLDCKFKDDWQSFTGTGFGRCENPKNKSLLHLENKSK